MERIGLIKEGKEDRGGGETGGTQEEHEKVVKEEVEDGKRRVEVAGGG